MKYMYKQTGLIVESGVKLDSALFQEVSEDEDIMEPELIEDTVEDVEEPEQIEDVAEDVEISKEAEAEKKLRTASRKKTTTSQKK